MTETKKANLGFVRRIWLLILLLNAIPAVSARGFSSCPQDVGTPAQILASLDKVVLETQAGSNANLTADISVSSSDGGPLGYQASVLGDTGWLQLGSVVSGVVPFMGNSVSAVAPGALRVIARTSGLPAGVYDGSVSIVSPGALNGAITVPVILVVRSQPVILKRPGSLQFSQRNGFADVPQPQTLSLLGSNTGFNVLVDTNQTGWLSVSPLQGTTPADLTVSVNPSGLTTGTYQALITIVGSGAQNPESATVTLAITDDPPPVSVSPKSFSLKAQFASHQPVSGNLLVFTNDVPIQVPNPGTDVSWLSVEVVDAWAGVWDTTTGHVIPQPARLRVSADPTGLPPGTYSGNVTVGDASHIVTVPVTLTVSSNDLIVPEVVAGKGWNTEITLVNSDLEPAPFTLRFWQSDGQPLMLPIDGVGIVAEYSGTIPVGSVLTLKTLGTDTSVAAGWAELLAGRSIGGTANLRQDGGSIPFQAAVTIAPSLGKDFLLPFDNAGSLQTGMSVVNTGSSKSTLSMEFRDEDGNQIVSDSITLPPRGSTAFFLSERYPQLGNLRGEVRCLSADNNMSVVGLRFTAAGSFAAVGPTAPNPVIPDNVVTNSVPYVIDGAGYKTTFVLVNPGTFPLPFSIVFHGSSNGELLSVPILGEQSTSEYSDVIPVGGVRIVETSGISGSIVQGWAEIVSPSNVGGTVVISEPDASGSSFDTALQIEPLNQRFVLPFDNSNGYLTVFGIVDSPPEGFAGTVIVRDQDGRILTIDSFDPGNDAYQSFLLSDRFPSTAGIRGTIEFRDVDVSALGLRFDPSGLLTTLALIPK